MSDFGLSRILLIDDEVFFCETFKDALADDGYELVVVHTGGEALRELSRQAIQVAIIDLQLPDMSGLDVLKTIRNSHLEVCSIMLTGHASMETAIKALNQGAYAYITKPYQVEEVRAIIRNAFEQQRLSRENRRLLEVLQESNRHLMAAKYQLEQFNRELESKVEKRAKELARERQKNERLTELDQLKSEFLAMISHELKTPLTSIIGYSTYLLNLSPQERMSEIVDGLTRISRNGYILLDLINKLLEFSKIEAGKVDLALEQFDLKEVVEEVSLITAPMAREKKLQLAFTSPNLPVLVEADREKIKQVILNLVSNAIKFTEKPDSQILIQLEDKGNDFVQVTVSDQGIGIPKQDQEVIFESFRQLDPAASRKTGGTGLGLAIAKKFIDIHQGKIWVESELQQGSRFIFQIPRRQPWA
ncbi:MAG: response regulator [bacterium]|nr:response regulator [bacterium]